jgi:hypothetical protein
VSFIQSAASGSDISTYTEGSCHEFAEAVHRHTGWPILIVYDKAEESILNDDDEVLHSLKHVACIDPDGNVWDVTGRVHRSGAARHCRKYMHFGRVGFDTLETYDDVKRYIGFGSYQVLAHQYDSTREWADRDARRVLRRFGILPPPEEFTDLAPLDGSGAFEEDYALGVASLNAAIGIATHFGYPVATAFGSDRRLVRAWAEDFDGRPVTSSGLLRDHLDLDLPPDCSIRIWEVPHHAMADGRLREVLGSDALDVRSVVDAFSQAKKAFPSIRDTILADGRSVTGESLEGYVRYNILEEAEYNSEYGGLTEIAKKGRPHRAAMAAVGGSARVLQGCVAT